MELITSFLGSQSHKKRTVVETRVGGQNNGFNDETWPQLENQNICLIYAQAV